MTQCWQHHPELRPDFASILERLRFCTQVCPFRSHICLWSPLTMQVLSDRSHKTDIHIPVAQLSRYRTLMC